MIKNLFLTLILLGPILLPGQSIDNIRLSTYRDSILVDYDILDGKNEYYSITLYASHDDFKAALNFVKGDIGDSVLSGSGKRITWEISKEFEEFNGPLAVEIRGQFKVMPIKIIDGLEKVKRGQNIEIRWTGGHPAKGFQMQLFKDELKIDEVQIDRERKFDYSVSKKYKPGEYILKLVSNDPLGGADTHPIRISRKIPLGVQLLPGYGLIGLGIIILTKPEPPSQLPFPPDPSKTGN